MYALALLLLMKVRLVCSEGGAQCLDDELQLAFVVPSQGTAGGGPAAQARMQPTDLTNRAPPGPSTLPGQHAAMDEAPKAQKLTDARCDACQCKLLPNACAGLSMGAIQDRQAALALDRMLLLQKDVCMPTMLSSIQQLNALQAHEPL